MPVTAEDLVRIPEIITNYDEVRTNLQNPKTGGQRIAYAKRSEDSLLIYLEEYVRSRNNLKGVSMWKYPPTADVGNVLAHITRPGLYVRNGVAAYDNTTADTGSNQDVLFQSATEEALQFEETAAQYGGEAAYKQAKADGETVLTYRQWVQVRTPAFKEWFGDWENDPDNASKVVNPKTGEPLVVYHGTDVEFDVFDRNKTGSNTDNGMRGKGFYMATDRRTAEGYGNRIDGNSKEEREFRRKAKVLQGKPVYTIDMRTAPQGFKALREWAQDIFDKAGNQAANPEIGTVLLNERSVRDSIAHGMNPFKAEAFQAVPDVIAKGAVVHRGENPENGVRYAYISAPVVIEGKEDIVTVLVRDSGDGGRMYPHSVATKESILNASDTETTEISRETGKVNSGYIANILRSYLKYKPKTDRTALDPSSDSLMTAIAKLGGLNKDELVRDANRLLNSHTLDTLITQELKDGNDVTLVGFGVFQVSERAERQGRNPQTGETLTIPATKKPRFRPGKPLKEAVK